MTDDKLAALLRRRAADGAGLLELVNLVHETQEYPPYSRGLLLRWFHEAFGFGPLDFTNIIWACKIFGDGATMELEEADRLFRARIAEIAADQTAKDSDQNLH